MTLFWHAYPSVIGKVQTGETLGMVTCWQAILLDNRGPQALSNVGQIQPRAPGSGFFAAIASHGYELRLRQRGS